MRAVNQIYFEISAEVKKLNKKRIMDKWALFKVSF